MRIAIDAMGGDHAPEAVVDGALLAASHCAAQLVLVGDEKAVGAVLAGKQVPAPVEVAHAPQAISMDEFGPVAFRKKRDCSINVAMRMLAEGAVDAVLSAGNTSGIVASAKHYVGLLSGLRRPALAVSFPTRDARPVMLDAGAHPQAGPVHLAQSAVLAHIYLKVTHELAKPRIGLLNIGQEPGKGTRTVQRAFELIRRSGLNFVGNVEPNDLFSGVTDAVICEGFVGNIVLKTFEGLVEGLLREMDREAAPGEAGCGGNPHQAYDGFREKYTYSQVGGAPLLGLKKPVVVAHGRSGATAIQNAVRVAFSLAGEGVCGKMNEELEGDSALADFKYLNAMLILDDLKKKWGFSGQKAEG